jgi:hypothetical protein
VNITKELALAQVAEIVAEQGAILDTLTPEQAAERAWYPGGPSRTEIAARFAAEYCCRTDCGWDTCRAVAGEVADADG